jgi:hypothetical protein
MYWFQADFVGSGKWFRRNRFPLGAVLMEIGILLGEQVAASRIAILCLLLLPEGTQSLPHDGLSPSPGWGRFFDSRGGELGYCWRI